MWNNNSQRWFLALLLLTVNTYAYGDCNARLISIEPQFSLSRYDVFSVSDTPLVQNYIVRADIEGQDCTAIVELDIGGNSNHLQSPNFEILKFEWHAERGFEKNGLWYIPLTENNATGKIQLRFPGKQWVSAGVYQNKLEASVIENGSNLLSYTGKKFYLDINAEVLPTSKVQFYGLSQRHYDLDFGELETGKSIRSSPRLWIQSTGGYYISIESDYDGNLRHDSLNPKWDIEYRMSIADKNIDMHKTGRQWRSGDSTSGSSLPINFVVGETKERRGGEYRDNIHISIEPDLSQMP
ncbi:hypothetical protein L3V77_20530 [Vibrio sp. DW001]|uniref:hypothetical protein n=1 Tax=Vibrio sp. DW001 TaxID=2912315 RepID=UPI0023B18950|nr:hypothetical protein [Vibrio sp. DW001]WED29796.1 hypothetical protein L3V77_20530 [Vibrio sp. DW001]